ncbi:MAG: hypothetical protein KAT15_23085, partial [Bacteroidales bacterium]|nr:hypothetical protein [Bacteroidales bacterium]
LIPMAISLAYGVAIGTVFILIFFPILIMLLNDIRVFFRKFWTGERPEREDVEVAVIHHRRKLLIEANGKKLKDAESNNTTE